MKKQILKEEQTHAGSKKKEVMKSQGKGERIV